MLRLFFVLLLIGNALFSYGQVLPPVAPLRQISIQPTQLLFREAVVAYQWSLSRQVDWQIEAGYRFNNPSAGPAYRIGVGLAAGYDLNQAVNPHHQAIRLATGPVFYTDESRRRFVQFAYFLRHWWLTNQRIQIDRHSSDDIDVLRTDRTNAYGIKLFMGTTGTLFHSLEDEEPSPLTYALYMGVGLRYKTFWYESRDGTIGGQVVNYLFERGQYWTPSVHLGLRLNLAFAK